ncbi:HAD-IIIC family phosphatase [Xanthobacter versatilis]|uniref:HAD-IIIC family phosphatase n=1 Tax=Xanthobacter autotrophicus (strain ATCC BAA-1158 / Py2) TaxID=78245 RepID=UPI003727DD41
MSNSFEPTASIKLVIWDLDETFWEGTLSEGQVRLIDNNINMVKTLTDRGIVSSISSKNDFDNVRELLTHEGLWDYFVFPQISWDPKGGSVASIIEQANLRPDNVLFIDDNSLNIEEIRFRFPTIMAGYPQDVLPHLLDVEATKGKDDRSHSRLKQYKQLENKVTDQKQTALSNDEFLRQCDIKLRFEYDVESHLPRVIELINRSNQLNYTKIRLETDEAVANFKEQLKRHDVFAAGIFAKDRYGDHGLIGFYMQMRNERINKLTHYVWSCRMMNSGLEQYVYERLGKPEIKIAQPVSNPIVTFPKVDWITEVTQDDQVEATGQAPQLLLIGSCDLTAVASYCSPNRIEFVNGVKNEVMTRYDDFGFILGDAAKVTRSRQIDKIPAWTTSDFTNFVDALPSSEILVVSLSAAMKGSYLVTKDGVVVRIHPEGLGNFIDTNPWAEFLKGVSYYDINDGIRTLLLNNSLHLFNNKATSAKHKFLLGANTRDVGGVLSDENRDLMQHYNKLCKAFCASVSGWHFVSIDDVVSREKLLDDRHYTRTGYMDIATYINERVRETASDDALSPTTGTEYANLSLSVEDVVRAGRPLSALSLFGSKRGGVAHIKRAIKLTPVFKVVRKFVVRESQPQIAG